MTSFDHCWPSVAIHAVVCVVVFLTLVNTDDDIERNDDKAHYNASDADVSRQTKPRFGVGGAATINIH